MRLLTPATVRARRKAAAVIMWGLLLGGALGGGASANSAFAALSVVPFGKQVYDLTTGVTTLPEGGTITDQDTGVSLEAGRIEYRADDYVAAWGVTLEGSFGVVGADSLRIDLVAGVLSAKGGVRLERDGLDVSAANLTFHADDQVVVFGGGVASTDPEFTADRVLLDVRSGDVLLVGEYVYQGGLFVMRSPEAGGLLALKLVEKGDAITYDASTEVPAEFLERFAPHL